MVTKNLKTRFLNLKSSLSFFCVMTTPVKATRGPCREGRSRRRCTRGFTAIELLVVIAIIGVLIAILLPAVQQSRETARRTQCRSQLHQLLLGVHNYFDAHQAFPIGSMTVGPSFPTASGWGWGAMLLPFVENSALYRKIDFDIGTGVGSNRQTISNPVPFWRCPSDSAPATIEVVAGDEGPLSVATGNYCGVEAVFRPMISFRPRDVTDGLSQTLFIGERVFLPSDGISLPYTSSWCGRIATRTRTLPNSIPHLPAIAAALPNSSKFDPNVFTSHHTGGVQFAFGDGSVRLLPATIDADVYAALGTRDGGEAVSF